MKWVRDYAWLAAPILFVIYFVWLRPARGPDPKAAIAHFEAQRADLEKKRAEWEAQRAEFDQQQARQRTDHTLFRLRILGEAYRDHLDRAKKPPQAADLAYITGDLTSVRDNEPFVITWGVDLANLKDGAGTLLAWEKSAADDGSRCVLMADGKTAKAVTAAEFAALPKATPDDRAAPR
jgi:chromosome condensin MukBEF ATPase and DNA-binding subunit MukB